MKLNDYDRGAPSICRASIVTRLVILQSYSQLLKKKKKKVGQRSEIQSSMVPMATWTY